MTSSYAIARRPRSGTPVAMQVSMALGLPVLAAITVVGIYLNKEAIVAAAWMAFVISAMVVLDPVIGIIIMTGGYLLAAYPTVLQSLGVLTVSNLIGVWLLALLIAQIIASRDLSFMLNRQVIVLAVIGILLGLSSLHSSVIFPLLQQSHNTVGQQKVIDNTSTLAHDFWTRLVFIMFFLAFVRGRREVVAVFITFGLVLSLAIPSALVNLAQGNLSHGFRVTANFTAGSNANRLAVICLMEVACFWCWFRARPGGLRGVIAGVVASSAVVVVLATGSRSGAVGTLVLAGLMQTSRRDYRVPLSYITAACVVGAIAVMTVVPTDAVVRALTFSSEHYELGGTSIEKREVTIDTGIQMVRDHPFLGVGLGNFREVSRQVYFDKFYRPPHNSYLWAAAEGGLLVFASYLLFFWITWQDMSRALELMHRDPSVVWVTVALRTVFLLYCAFAAVADLWLNPITYVLVGLIMALRKHLESIPPSGVPSAVALAR
jgi:O-antigen ligase